MEMLSLIQKKHRSGLEQIPLLHHAQHMNYCNAFMDIFNCLVIQNINIQEKWEEDPNFMESLLIPKRLEIHFKSYLS